LPVTTNCSRLREVSETGSHCLCRDLPLVPATGPVDSGDDIYYLFDGRLFAACKAIQELAPVEETKILPFPRKVGILNNFNNLLLKDILNRSVNYMDAFQEQCIILAPRSAIGMSII
jgi:hypothetical protein